jgi:uncharacterized protein with PQ loop repeat
MEIVGWIGTVCLSCCGVPQLLASIKDSSKASGFSYSYLVGWIIGILVMMVYIHLRENASYPYPLQVANIVSLSCACSFMCIRLRLFPEPRLRGKRLTK